MARLGRIFASTLLLATGCSVGADDGAGQAVDRAARVAASAAYEFDAAAPLRVVAVGDIACPPGSRVTRTTCRHSATAALARRLDPELVLTLGDNQYQEGTLAQFRGSYAPTWGTLLSRTRPAPGNHEYRDRGARGYYTYFGDRQPGPPGYYRVRANNWQVFVLNSNCDRVDCAAQASWLSREMTANPSRCSAIVLHHPRYSSGEHGNHLFVRRLWAVAYAHHNDVVLSGHDHDYERFRPMDNRGRVDLTRGMVEFVSGAGGKSLYSLDRRKTGSVYFQARAHGVLYLDLQDTRYSWAFRNIYGNRMDAGSRPCVA
jgi:acid phosphatase type 7